MKKTIAIILISLSVMSLQAYASGNPYSLTQALSQVETSVEHPSQSQISPEQSMRDEAIGRVAKVYGAQSGRYYRWKQIETLLYQRADLLSRVFNFGSMYLDKGLVQPPVLDMSSNVTHISDSGQVRSLVDNVYRVLIPANFKPRPMMWQSFLIPDSLSKPAFPRTALMPRNSHEKQLWHQDIKKGWPQGVEEANEEFSARLTSLNNAYQGMVLYTMLAMRGMIASPHIVMTNKAVKKASNGQTMAVGVHRQVIARKSYFVAEPNHWRPIYYSHHFSLHGD